MAYAQSDRARRKIPGLGLTPQAGLHCYMFCFAIKGHSVLALNYPVVFNYARWLAQCEGLFEGH